jgi:hypothetical protein
MIAQVNASDLSISLDWATGRRNTAWSRALDGRVVSSHYLWIETSSADLDSTRRGPVVGCAENSRCCEILADVTSDCGRIVAAGRPSVDESVRERVQLTLDLLAASKMDTFPLLSGGVIPVNACTEVTGAGRDGVTATGSPDEIAESVLTFASHVVISRWQEAMSEWGARSSPAQPLRGLNAIVALLAGSLQYEYYRRSGNVRAPWRDIRAAVARQDVLTSELLRTPPSAIFHSSPNESIVAELVSYHYPFWDRAYFCFNSPWDSFRIPTAAAAETRKKVPGGA